MTNLDLNAGFMEPNFFYEFFGVHRVVDLQSTPAPGEQRLRDTFHPFLGFLR